MREDVIRDLMGNWDASQGEAENLVAKHQLILDDAQALGSKPYFAAQQIGLVEKLTYTGVLDDKKKISNMDDTKSSTKTVAGWWNAANNHYQNCFHTDCELCTEFEKYALSVDAVEDD